MKFRVFGIVLLLLLASRCTAKPPQAEWIPVAEPLRTNYEDRMIKLYHTVKMLDDVPYEWGGTSPRWGMDCSVLY